MTEPLDQAELVRELAGNRCQCGARKIERQSFCERCYFKLPKGMRLALYGLIGQGYEEAYQAAISRIRPTG